MMLRILGIFIFSLVLIACRCQTDLDAQAESDGLFGMHMGLIDYKNDAVVGTQKNYYKNGNLKNVAIYDGSGKFQESWFYPDAVPLRFVSGTYQKKDAGITRVISHSVSYDELGFVCVSGNKESDIRYILRTSAENKFVFNATEMICAYEVIFTEGGIWKVLAYISPKNNNKGGRAKMKASASFDFENNKFFDISQTNYYGEFWISFKVNEEGVAYVHLLPPDGEFPLLVFYAGKPATFKRN